MAFSLTYECLIIHCSYTDTGKVDGFLCIPAKDRISPFYHPMLIQCTILPSEDEELDRNNFHYGVIAQVMAHIVEYDDEDMGSLITESFSANVCVVAEEEKRLAIMGQVVDNLADGVFLGDKCWQFVKERKDIIPLEQQLLQCLEVLHKAGKLTPKPLAKRIHGWLDSSIEEVRGSRIGFPELWCYLTADTIGGPPRIYCAKGSSKAETYPRRWDVRVFSVSIIGKPKVLDGDVFLDEARLQQFFAWVKSKQKSLLKHWRRKVGYTKFMETMLPLVSK